MRGWWAARLGAACARAGRVASCSPAAAPAVVGAASGAPWRSTAALLHLRPLTMLRGTGSGLTMPMSSSRSLSTVAALEPDDAAAFRPLQLPMQIGPLALNRIRDNLGARPKKRRVGRGVGSGRGRHCGRGMKGRKQRAGNHNLLRNDGGQTRLQKKLPKLGHWRPRLEYVYINLCKLQDAIKRGHLTVPTDRPIGVKDLFDAKLITLRQRHSGVHLMARGGETFDMPLNIEVQLASQRAIEVVEAAGGSVESVYYSRLTLRALLKPHRFEAAPVGKRHGAMRPRPALPPPKLMRDIYMSERHRGYLRNLAPGDVVRPQEHPSHVDLSLRQKPYYPGWAAADQQAMALGKPYIKPDGTVTDADAPPENMPAYVVQAGRPNRKMRPYIPGD